MRSILYRRAKMVPGANTSSSASPRTATCVSPVLSASHDPESATGSRAEAVTGSRRPHWLQKRSDARHGAAHATQVSVSDIFGSRSRRGETHHRGRELGQHGHVCLLPGHVFIVTQHELVPRFGS